jgi:signal transduction histidine kinase
LALALLPMLVVLPILLGITIYRWNLRFDATLISKVHNDLTIAHQYWARLLDDTQEQLTAITESARFQDLLVHDDTSRHGLATLLDQIMRERHFDFLYIVSDGGRLVASAQPMHVASPRWQWPIIVSALRGQSRTAIDVFSPADLAAFSAELVDRAHLDLVPTPDASETTRTQETRGMMIHAASAFTLPDGRRAALVAGMLLNRNLAFIDTMNGLIYHDAGLPEGSRGTATLFLDDVRISTNVRLFKDRRALGTRVSAPVRAAVLDEGRTWLDSAFVVNDWYISAYEPITDSYGRRVGMLYAGFLQRPFTDAKRQTVLGIVAAFLIAVIATVPLFLKWARNIFRPLEQMTLTIARIENGDPDARTGHVDGTDEIGRVASHLDHLLDQLQERESELRRWNDELHGRVEARAHELQQANQQLEHATAQLIMAEKLAAIGEITAGVAHEINNPIAVMQGNLEVIRDAMGSRADAAKTEFRLIDEQMQRIGEIVTRLLQFAKPHEYAGYSERHDVASIVTDTLPLVRHLLAKAQISVDTDFQASRLVLMNRTELQQVLVNLMVNGIHAMPDGGRLIVRTFDSDEDGRRGVAIAVGDTGLGMAPDVAHKVFDPFFTTKGRGGTGLGLSISQMLVTRLGGTIAVESDVGKGTTFTVWLPEAS